jgi:hypothetical protein
VNIRIGNTYSNIFVLHNSVEALSTVIIRVFVIALKWNYLKQARIVNEG